MLTDTETARELVTDLRQKLLSDSDQPPYYLNWKEVRDEIVRRLHDDIDLQHILALGACSDIDPQSESECVEALVSFCKLVALESHEAYKYAEAS